MMAGSFPAYRDVVQPLQLGGYELRHGLSLLAAAAQAPAPALQRAAAGLMAFPAALSGCSAGELADARVAQLADNLDRFLAAHPAPGDEGRGYYPMPGPYGMADY